MKNRKTASTLALGIALFLGVLVLPGCGNLAGPTEVPRTTNGKVNPPLVAPVSLLVTNPIVIKWLIDQIQPKPVLGQYYQGKVLTVNVVSIERTFDVRYSTVIGQDLTYIRLSPSRVDQEIVLVRVRVQNHKEPNVFLDVGPQSAVLQDDKLNIYRPLNVANRGEKTSGSPKAQSIKLLELNPDGTFPPTTGFLRGPLALQMGMGVDGWLVFEAPSGTGFNKFEWLAGDSVTIPLR